MNPFPRRARVGVAYLVAAIAQPENIAVISDIGPSTPSGPRVLKGDYSVDPERILSAEPDLVLLTTRHGQEKDASAPAPRVLALMSRGELRMVAPSTTLLRGLIAEAGGEPVTGNASGRGPVPADPELIASLNPDVILVEDFRGRGRADFEAILSNPSLRRVPAVARGRIHYLPSDQVTAAGAARVGEGLVAVTDAVWGGENN
ncbi:ABC transporter substrate-binding protein [uncultured Corynebacterium sp.]|uniref:ABC transporter substrate-binding protein n=1 Tax=uncultured Corynebacterium sp. TaxID=159447 RepID=UPI00259365A5|nr:ABC transporter substrate-binding protein [uncultured Corynebacterium sp.]